MMVKMLTDTVFEGKTLKIGDAVEQSDSVVERWIKNGIAEKIIKKASAKD